MFSASRIVVAFALFALSSTTAFAQPGGRWVREIYAAYPDRDTAVRVANAISSNNVTGWRNGFAESAPHPVTRSYGVYGERFYPNANPPQQGQQEVVMNGSLTRSDPMDRLRLNMHAKTISFTFVAGRTYQIDLMSGDGKSGPHNPRFFDTWLRIEDAQGNIKEQNDDGGEGLNSRVIFRPTQTAVYTIVVTSYASRVTGDYTLRIR